MTQELVALTWLAVALIGLVVYLVPFSIAAIKRHPRLKAILALNILAGWTTIGWVAALIWALLPEKTGAHSLVS